jgi:hypothetical protein
MTMYGGRSGREGRGRRDYREYLMNPFAAQAEAKRIRADYQGRLAAERFETPKTVPAIKQPTEEDVKEPGFWSKVGDVAEFSGKTTAGTVYGLTGLIPGTGGGRKKALSGLTEMVKAPFSDEAELMSGYKKMREAQAERGKWARLASEIVLDPINLIPLGWVGKPVVGAYKALRGTRAAGAVAKGARYVNKPVIDPTTGKVIGSTKELVDQPIKRIEVDRLSSSEEVVDFIGQNLPVGSGPLAKGFGKWKLGKWISGLFGVEKFDIKSPIHRIVRADRILREQAQDMSTILLTKLNVGGMKRLFGHGEDGITNIIKDGKKASFQEIAQHPENYKDLLTGEQMQYLKDIDSAIQDMHKYLVQIGADPDDLLGRVSGNYFPNMWKFLDGVRLESLQGTGTKLVTPKPQYQFSRFYQEAEEAIEKGFRGDPGEALEILFNSMYNRAADKQIVDMLMPFSVKMTDRIDPQLTRFYDRLRIDDEVGKEALTFISRLSKGMLPIVKGSLRTETGPLSIQDYMAVNPIWAKLWGTKAGKSHLVTKWKDEMNNIMRKHFGNTKRMDKAFKRLEVRAKRDLAIKTRQIPEAQKAVSLSKARAALRRDLGEKQFPMGPFSGRIFTSKELLQKNNVDAVLSDLKTFNKQELKELTLMLRPQTNTLLEASKNVSSMMRLFQTGFDLGVGFLHGIPTLITNPVLWAKTQKVALQAIYDPKSYGTFVRNHQDTLTKMMRSNHLHGGGADTIEALRKGNILAKGFGALGRDGRKPVQIAGKGGEWVLESFANQFNSSILASKVYLYEAMEGIAEHSIKRLANLGLDEAEFLKHERNIWYKFNDTISKMTGTVSMANVGVTPTGQSLIGGWLMFSQRYNTAVIDLMKHGVRGGLRKTRRFLPGRGPLKAHEIADNLQSSVAAGLMGKMAVGGMLFYSAIAKHMNQPVNLDPSDSGFMTVTIGDTRVGIGSRFTSMARLAGKLVRKGIADPNSDFSLDDPRYGDTIDVALKAIRSQIAPMGSATWDLVTGADYLGDPTRSDLKSLLAFGGNQVLPFWLSGQYDQPSPGWLDPDRGTQTVTDFLGLRSWPESYLSRAKAQADIIAQRDFGVNYDQLQDGEKKRIRLENESIDELMTKNEELWGNKVGRNNEFFNKKDIINDEYEKELGKELEYLQRGTFIDINDATGEIIEYGYGGAEFREQLKTLQSEKRGANWLLDGQYTDVIEDLDRRRLTKEEMEDKGMYLQDIALAEYKNTIIGGDFDNPITGRFDYDRREEEELAFWEGTDGNPGYGPDIKQYVQETLSMETPTILREYYDGRRKFRMYWNVGEEILTRTGESSKVQEWKRYKRTDEEEQEELRDELRWLSEVVAAEKKAHKLMRQNNAELDEWLWRWGFPGDPQHFSHRDRDLDDLKDMRRGMNLT